MIEIGRIAKACSAKWHVSYYALLGSSQRGSLPHTRAALCLLCRMIGYDVDATALALGRTASAVRHMINNGHGIFEKNPIFRDRLEACAKELGVKEAFKSLAAKLQTRVEKKTKPEPPRRYHPPFCMYTEEEELAYQVAIADAARFMEGFGRKRAVS